MTTRTLVVWCPDWPVMAAGFPPSTPVAVMFANRVVACSAAARADGVGREQRRRQAQSRCPELVVVERDPARDARAFEHVVASVEAFCPGVEVVRPGVCAFATRGPSRYFGGDRALAERVTMAVERVLAARSSEDLCRSTTQILRTSCRVGVADGPFAAEQAARRALIVPPGESVAFLAPLPTHVLERPELTDLLRRLGVRTLGDLAALARASVVARFGPEGRRAHRLASGLDERPLAARVPPPDLQVSTELDPPAERVDVAAFAAKALADELHARLSDRGLACSRVCIAIETEHGERRARTWRHDGALSAGMLAERVRWQLDGWLSTPGAVTAGITLLRLTPDEVHADDGRQLGFWGGDRAAADRAARALVRVQGMLGPEAVVTAVVGGGRGPVERVRLVPWGDARAAHDTREVRELIPRASRYPTGTHVRAETPVWPGRVPAPAPAIVHRAPLVAEVVGASGTAVTVTGRGGASTDPARLSIGGGPWAEIAAWAGPWPVDEHWWTPSPRRRARWQVLTADGSAYLLAVEGGRWFVEATYD
jgi:protein ImuB